MDKSQRRTSQKLKAVSLFNYIVTVERAVSQLPHILPDYMLVFAVPILTHDPAFTAYDNVAQLKVKTPYLNIIFVRQWLKYYVTLNSVRMHVHAYFLCIVQHLNVPTYTVSMCI